MSKQYEQLEHSTIRLYTHEASDCTSGRCTFHKRTDHHMRSFPQFYRFDRGIMERKCTHGVGHPDPDDTNIINGVDDGSHECDGCCIRFATEEEMAAYELR